jgi:hypothetical protein
VSKPSPSSGLRSGLAGYFFYPMPDRRVVVFIDYQNAYREIRRSFFDDRNDPAIAGQFDPLALALQLTATATSSFGGATRSLEGVRIYCGLPDPVKQPQGYAATSRQIGKWGSDPRVRVFARPLTYPRNWPTEPPRQKGVDVWLAVQYLGMAIRRQYDVGILISRDTDLVPALEEVQAIGGQCACEVVTWAPNSVTAGRLRTPGHPLWCHYIDRAGVEAIKDSRDYNVP